MSIELIEQPDTTNLATAAFAMPTIGSRWDIHGGIYAGLIRGVDGAPDGHLIASDAAEGELVDRAWGEYGQDVPGAKHKVDGLGNTNAMADAGSKVAAEVRALRC